jgi:dolichyl-phosphooligosaccharide-protein glycotransferase
MRIRNSLKTLLYLLPAFILSGIFRILLPFHNVFTDSGIAFNTPDAYARLRIIDCLAQNPLQFTSLSKFDPFYYYSFGGKATLSFFDWLIASVIHLVSGAPSQHLIDTFCAYYPAILGMLIIIPVYFLARTLFGKFASVISAYLIAVLPGEFLGRTMLGSMDYHVMEVLLLTTALLFFVLALRKKWYYSFAAGFFFGLYLITWGGALLLAFIICIYVFIQVITDLFRKKPTAHLIAVAEITLVIAGMMFVPFHPEKGLIIGLLIFTLAIPIFYHPSWVTMLGLFCLSFLFLKFDSQSYIHISQLWAGFIGIFGYAPDICGASESIPLLSNYRAAWDNFTTGFILSPGAVIPGLGLAGLIILITRAIREKGENGQLTLFLVWSAVMMLAMLQHARYSYYFAINIAILTAFVAVQTYNLMKNLKPLVFRYYATVFLFLFVFAFNILGSVVVASTAPFAPTKDWHQALEWISKNTPEPFIDAQVYYRLFNTPEIGKPAYTVTSWWDYGYWIMRIGHRIPNVAGCVDSESTIARLMMAEDDITVARLMDELNSRYLIIDKDMVTTKFWAIVQGRENQGDDYSNTLISRLYLGSGDGAPDFKLVYSGDTVKVFEYSGHDN